MVERFALCTNMMQNERTNLVSIVVNNYEYFEEVMLTKENGGGPKIGGSKQDMFLTICLG